MGKTRKPGEPSIGAAKDAIGVQRATTEGNLALQLGIPVDPGTLLMNAAAAQERGGVSAKIGSTGAVASVPASTPVTGVKGSDSANIVSLEHMQLKQQYDLLLNAYNTLVANHEILVNRAAFLEKQVRENMPELANPIDLGDTITLPDGRKMSLADAVTWAATGGGAIEPTPEPEEEIISEEEPEEEIEGSEPSIAIG